MKIINIQERSKEWYEWRQKGIGASDIPVILGSSPYKTAFQLWEEKCGFKNIVNVQNDAMKFGIKMEEKARNWINKNLNFSFKSARGEDLEIKYFHVSLDGLDMKKESILEIKCPSSEKVLDQAKNKDFPLYWLEQIQWQLIVSKAKYSYLGVWDWREKRCMFSPIFPDIEKQALMVEKAKEFWHKVISGETPELTEKDYIEISDPKLEEFIDEYIIADSEEKKYKTLKKDLKEKIIDFGDDGNFQAYGVKIKRCQPSSSYNLKKMKEDGINIEKYKVQKNEIGYYKIILPR